MEQEARFERLENRVTMLERWFKNISEMLGCVEEKLYSLEEKLKEERG